MELPSDKPAGWPERFMPLDAGPLHCSEEDHPPFNVIWHMVDDDRNLAELYMAVRTNSWDGTSSWGGERTDLHDVFSSCWAMLLRARERASVRMIDVPNPATHISGEVYARVLLLGQPDVSIDVDEGILRHRAELMPEAALAYHALDSAFGIQRSSAADIDQPALSVQPPWFNRVCRILRVGQQAIQDAAIHRQSVGWTYFTSTSRRFMVAQIPPAAAELLRGFLAAFKPQIAVGVQRTAFRTENFRNAVPTSLYKRAITLARAVDGASTGGDVSVVPVDSHCIALGAQSLIALKGECGRAAYEDECLLVEERRRDESGVFTFDYRFSWAQVLDPGRFQSLILALLEAEPGMRHVREVGSVHDRDAGRDFIAEWYVAPDRGGKAPPGTAESNDMNTMRIRRVLVQAKARRDAVNKSDVLDIRDTMEHHECDGYLLVAFPRITAPLCEHLDRFRVRSSGTRWIDWWERMHLEERLRGNSHLLPRFPDVVKLHM